MGEQTGIAWTDATWNPWMGCHKVSEACAHCYMYRDSARYGRDPETVVRSKTTFRNPLKWKEPRKIFTCSWSDFFIEEADGWRAEAWEIIRQTPQHTYQILTKRPERIPSCLPADFLNDCNVWLGITAENDKRLHERMTAFYPMSFTTIAFVSIEPMLSEINLLPFANWIDWVICGCESGPKARETKIEWVRDLRDQCTAAGIPFFLKQLLIDGKLVTTPELDGKRWTELPEVSQ